MKTKWLQLCLFDEDFDSQAQPNRGRSMNQAVAKLEVLFNRQLQLFGYAVTCTTCGKSGQYKRETVGTWIEIRISEASDRSTVGTRRYACSVACLPVDTSRKSHTREPTRVAFVPSDPDGLMEIF